MSSALTSSSKIAKRIFKHGLSKYETLFNVLICASRSDKVLRVNYQSINLLGMCAITYC